MADTYLTFVKQVQSKSWKTRGEYLCRCGRIIECRNSDVKSGNTRSCGCLHRRIAREMHIVHGGARTRTHRIWKGMIQRCTNPKMPQYHRYGGRGITVCERWLKFANFREDMGDVPPGMSLDRKNNDGNYEKDNCKWSTRLEQANNTGSNFWIEYDGKRMTLAQWSRALGLERRVIGRRIRSGWSVEKAFKTKEVLHAERWGKAT